MRHVTHRWIPLTKLYKQLEINFFEIRISFRNFDKKLKIWTNFQKYSGTAVFIKRRHVIHRWIPLTNLYKQL